MLISVIFSTIYHNIQQIIEACVEPLIEMYSHWKFFLQFVIFSRIRRKKAVCWKLSLFFSLNSASISQWKTPYAALRSSIVVWRNCTKTFLFCCRQLARSCAGVSLCTGYVILKCWFEKKIHKRKHQRERINSRLSLVGIYDISFTVFIRTSTKCW